LPRVFSIFLLSIQESVNRGTQEKRSIYLHTFHPFLNPEYSGSNFFHPSIPLIDYNKNPLKNRKALILLLTANIVSGIAQGISMIAIPWYFAQQGALSYFVYFYILANCISLFWVPFSGTLIDKYNRKTIFLCINAISAVILGLITYYGYSQGQLNLWIVASVFVMTMLNYSIHYPCLYAFVQEITPKEDYGKITSILEVQGQSTSILGGAIAAVLMEGTKDGYFNIFGYKFNFGFEFQALKIYDIFFLDFLTYIVALTIISFIFYVPLVIREVEHVNVYARLKIGWDYLMNHKMILLFGVVSYIIFVCVLLEGFYLGALYVSAHLKASAVVYASSDIAYSIGALISGFSIRYIFKKLNIPASLIILTFITALINFTLFATNSVNLFYLMLFGIGLCNAGSRILRVTYLFNNIPNQVFGRSASIFNIANILIRILLLSLFATTFFHAGNNVIYAFLILSFLLIIAACIMILNYKKFDLTIY